MIKWKDSTILIKHFPLLFATLLACSCSPILNYFERDEIIVLKEKKMKPLYCETQSSLNVIHHSDQAVSDFSLIRDKLVKKYRFNFAELSIAYIVYQGIVRPAASHLDNRLQVMIKDGKKTKYYDFNKLNKMSYKDSLRHIARDYKTRGLRKILRQLKIVFPGRFTVQQQLVTYLKENAKKLKKKDEMTYLFKLKKPLEKGETFSSQPQSFDYPRLRPKKNLASIVPFFDMKLSRESKYKLSCNFDTGLYQNGLLLSRKTRQYSNIFALTNNKDRYFLAYSSRTSKKTSSPAPLCFYQDDNKEIILVSFATKDPGQTLYHLINYDIFNAKDPEEIIQYNKFPRHEILTKPSRLLFESKKSSASQLDYFLSLSLPVYHVESLGEVWTLYKNRKQPSSYTFISDSRKAAFQSCLNNN